MNSYLFSLIKLYITVTLENFHLKGGRNLQRWPIQHHHWFYISVVPPTSGTFLWNWSIPHAGIHWQAEEGRLVSSWEQAKDPSVPKKNLIAACQTITLHWSNLSKNRATTTSLSLLRTNVPAVAINAIVHGGRPMMTKHHCLCLCRCHQASSSMQSSMMLRHHYPLCHHCIDTGAVITVTWASDIWWCQSIIVHSVTILVTHHCHRPLRCHCHCALPLPLRRQARDRWWWQGIVVHPVAVVDVHKRPRCHCRCHRAGEEGQVMMPRHHCLPCCCCQCARASAPPLPPPWHQQVRDIHFVTVVDAH